MDSDRGGADDARPTRPWTTTTERGRRPPLQALLDYFVPANLRGDLDTYRRARLTVLFPVVGVFAAFYVVPLYQVGFVVGALAMGAACAINLLSPWLLRWTGSVHLVGHLLATTALALHTFFIVVGGGPTSVFTMWLVVSPLIALLLVGPRASLVWVILAVADIGGLHALERYVAPFPERLPEGGPIPLAIMSHLGFTVGIYILARLMDHGKDHTLAAVREARRQAEAAMRTSQEMAETLQAQNAQIADQARQLRALDEAKSHFFANVSHELRTPLTLIVGPLAKLHAEADGTLPEAVREQVAMMLRNGQRLQRLINQILDFTKLEAGRLVLEARPADLVAFVRRHVQLYEGMAEYKGVDLAFEPAASACPVTIDPEQFEKVLANLLSNALKFSHRGGRITVTVRADDGAAAVAVADMGVGIPEEKQPHIFNRFYQADRSATRIYEGTGIGLALVKELVALHGGTVEVESAPGQGSTFTVRLPMATPTEAPAAPPAEAHGGGSLPQPAPTVDSVVAEPTAPDPRDQTTVLVVEDNADMRAFIRSILAPDYRILEAVDGVAGLARARADLPDLILADVMMPEMDGLAMSRALAADPATDAVPVVLLTARAAHDDRIDGLETGADAYLVKPFDADVLRLQVNNLITRQHRLRAQLAQAAPEPAPAPPSAFEQQVREIIGAHLTDPQFSVELLAEAVALSRQQLYRRLREETDETPVTYIRRYRLDCAARLLRERQGTISEVAYAVGFNSRSYFSRCFREHFGETPTDFLLREVS